MATFEEQQKILRDQIPQGTPGAQLLQSQGSVGVGNNVSTDIGTNVANNLSKVKTGSIGPGGEPIFDVFAGEEHIQDPKDSRLTGIDIANLPDRSETPEGFVSKFKPSPFRTGFEAAKAAGINEIPSGGQARAVISQFTPTTATAVDSGTNFLQGDSFFNNLVSNFQNFISPANQKASLTETYANLLKSSNIQSIDTELIDMKNVIDGTEDDIRNEITATGGFATESQIVALANSRNKQLIKNYNTLLETRNAKERYLNTQIGLEAADREAADAKFEQSMNFGFQINELQQRMKNNAIESFDRVIQTIGWEGLVSSMSPFEISLLERTYGLPEGGALRAAEQETLSRARAQEERGLDIQEKRLGLQLQEAQIQGIPLERALKQAQISNVYDQITKRQLERVEKQQREEKAVKGQVEKANIVIDKVQETTKLLTGRTRGFLASGLAQTLTGFIGGTPAKNLKAKIDTIQAVLSFDELQKMRDSSPTGGALGQVSEREIELLGSAVASLDPSQAPSQLQNALDNIFTHYSNWLGTVGYSVTPDGDIVPIR